MDSLQTVLIALLSGLVGAYIGPKVNEKIEQRQWLRNNKLLVFAKLTRHLTRSIPLTANTPKAEYKKILIDIETTGAEAQLLVKNKKIRSAIGRYISTIYNIARHVTGGDGNTEVNKRWYSDLENRVTNFENERVHLLTLLADDLMNT